MLKYIVFLGGGVNLAGSFLYIKGVVKGEVKPNKVSYLMWSLAPLIASVAAFSAGARLAVIPVFIVGFIPFLVFVVSFVNPKAYWKLEIFDYICGGGNFSASILGYYKKSVNRGYFFHRKRWIRMYSDYC